MGALWSHTAVCPGLKRPATVIFRSATLDSIAESNMAADLAASDPSDGEPLDEDRDPSPSYADIAEQAKKAHARYMRFWRSVTTNT